MEDFVNEMVASKKLSTREGTILKANVRHQSSKDPCVEERTTNMLSPMINHKAYNNKNYNWSLDDFELGAFLGRGKFGRVFAAREIATQMIVAIKVLLKSEIAQMSSEKMIVREIEIMSHLKHPNILNLYTWFHDEKYIYLVIEFAANGELYDFLKMQPHMRFSENRYAARYIYQVANALMYCHTKKVMHRDLKPENLLLSKDYRVVKLADFGWSIHAPQLSRNTMCGTLDYLPPEMVKNARYNKNVDNWCLGILCYEFLVGRPPFESNDSKTTQHKIVNEDIVFPEWVSSGAKDLILKLANRNMNKRISLQEVVRHPWIIRYMSD